MPLDDDYSDGKSDGNAYSDEEPLADEYEDEPVDDDEDGDEFVPGVHEMDDVDQEAESAPDQVHGHELNERSTRGLAHNNAQSNLHGQGSHKRNESGSGMNAYNQNGFQQQQEPQRRVRPQSAKTNNISNNLHVLSQQNQAPQWVQQPQQQLTSGYSHQALLQGQPQA